LLANIIAQFDEKTVGRAFSLSGLTSVRSGTQQAETCST